MMFVLQGGQEKTNNQTLGMMVWLGRAIYFIVYAKSFVENLCLFIFTFVVCTEALNFVFVI